MYPPSFNLRHFMSHLAPGGYVCLWIVLFCLFLFWLPYPDSVESFLVSVKNANPILLSIGFVVFIVISYFVGVVLRLPPVDHVDTISMEWNLRDLLRRTRARKAKGSERLNSKRSSFLSCLWCWIKPSGPPSLRWKQIIDDLSAGSNTTKPETETSRNPIVEDLDPALPDIPSGLPDILDKYRARDVIRRIAAQNLNPEFTPETKPSDQKELVDSLEKKSDTKFAMYWLWAVDAFPYPLWLIYKTFLQTTQDRRKKFSDHLWVVMIATMRGTISAKRTSKESFNNCKRVVCKKSDPLAASIHDDEALIRMMVGFYWGLWIASRGAAIAIILLMPFWIYYILTLITLIPWTLPHSATICGMVMLFFIISFICNAIMIRQVTKNFHILRVSEAQIVFDSYLIVCEDSIPSQTSSSK
jgi:hypothetical protein